MKFKVERHPLVERDVLRIAAFLLNYTTPESVASTLDQIDRDVEALRQNPYRGTRHDDILNGMRAIPSSGKGVIAFQVIEDRRIVRIMAVSWAGGNWQGWVTNRG